MALDRTTIPLCLAVLGLDAEDWGPDTSSYAALSAGWRGSVACPSEAALEGELAGVEAHVAAVAGIRTLEASVTQRRLRDAVLSQAGQDWLAGVEAEIALLREDLIAELL